MRFKAILKLYPNAVSLYELDGVKDIDGNTIIIDEDLIQAEINATTYSKLREVEYNKLNQFELISDDTLNGTTTHIDAILAIKAMYPKPQ